MDGNKNEKGPKNLFDQVRQAFGGWSPGGVIVKDKSGVDVLLLDRAVLDRWSARIHYEPIIDALNAGKPIGVERIIPVNFDGHALVTLKSIMRGPGPVLSLSQDWLSLSPHCTSAS